MNRRMRKAHRMNKAADPMVVRQGVEELDDYLEVADNMIAETASYPLYDQPFDMNRLDAESYDYVVQVHKAMQSALSDWNYMMRSMARRD